MALRGQLVFEEEIKSPGRVFLDIHGCNRGYVPKICSSVVTRVDLLEGKWGQVGCVSMVYYSIDGKNMKSKDVLEAVDEENKLVTYNMLEGDLMKLYKSLRFTFQIVSKNGTEYFKATVEFEKMNQDVPYPNKLKEFVSAVTRSIDAHYSLVSN